MKTLKVGDQSPREDIDLPPIRVRLHEAVGLLPAGFVYEVPREYALSWVKKRLATVVGSVDVLPDLVIDETEIDAAMGIDASALKG